MATETATVTEAPVGILASPKASAADLRLQQQEGIQLSSREEVPSANATVFEDQGVKLTKDTVLKLLSAGFSFFFAGTSDGCLGALIPYILQTHDISTDLIAVIYAAAFAGWVLAAVTNSHLLKYLGFGAILIIGACLQLLAHILRVWGPPYALFATSFFFTSLGQAY
ncbi:hypothetical protein TWF696_005815 [Orbilia brochopaga]|uniref:Major facilitator superfamily (MFS) profile domain-containing protein n=1 Tax=Orbilia brochopaga TaxID=3140254 RepID=A0AAV9UU94_9PEZI